MSQHAFFFVIHNCLIIYLMIPPHKLGGYYFNIYQHLVCAASSYTQQVTFSLLAEYPNINIPSGIK